MARFARGETWGDIVLATSTALPFRSGSVDIVVSSASLKDWGDRVSGLRELRRLLGAYAVALVFDFITSGLGSAPNRFRDRFGLLSDVFRALSQFVIPFSVADAEGLARTVGGEVSIEADLGVVLVAMRRA